MAVGNSLDGWSEPKDALPKLPRWAAWGRTWAPSAARLAGRYVLYFAARHETLGVQCVGAAVAHQPDGPFKSVEDRPLVCEPELGGSIDPYPFVDGDGTPFLLWKTDANAIGRSTTISARRLRSDGLAFQGQGTVLLRSADGWEAPLIENPALVATGGHYTLFYSGGWWASPNYAVGYATCARPLGPCTKVTVDRPLLGSTDDEVGPGGASVLTGSTGDQWLVYHAWSAGAVGYGNGGARSLRLAQLRWVGGRPAATPLDYERSDT